MREPLTATTILDMTAADGINHKGLVIGATNLSPTSFAFTASNAGAGSLTLSSMSATVTTPNAFSWTGSGLFPLSSTSDPSAPGVAPAPGPALPLITHTFERTGDFFTLTWASILGKRYQVEWTDSLTDWSTGGQSAPISAIDTISSYLAPTSNAPSRFYRVRQLP